MSDRPMPSEGRRRRVGPRARIAAVAVSALAVGLAVPALAGGGDTSDNAGHDQACGTTTANGTTQCFSSIQAAVDFAGEGGTVNVGPGTYDEHLTITNGVTLRGSGNETVIEGTLTAPLIDVNLATSATATPVTIQQLRLEATSAAGTGYLMVIKDRNPSSLDTVSGLDFQDNATQRDYGLDNENSTAAVTVTDNTFSGMAVGVLVDVNSETSSGALGADFVTGNSFNKLVGVTKAPKGIDVSINTGNGNPDAAAQVFDGNQFSFDGSGFPGSTAIAIDGSGPIGQVAAHDNNFNSQDVGVTNASSSNVGATDNWWGCPDGPTGTQDHCASVSGPVSYNPWLEHPSKR
jgi:hypothetical protein